MKEDTKWKALSVENKPARSGHEYLVAEDTGTGGCQMVIARWFNSGDVTDIKADVPNIQDDATDDMKLLNSIINSVVEVRIQISGFYVITKDEDMMDHSVILPVGAIEGLCRVADYSSDGVYWADMPDAPEGLMHPNTMRDNLANEIEKQKAKFMKEKNRALMEFKAGNDEFDLIRDEYMEYLSRNEIILNASNDIIDYAVVIAVIIRKAKAKLVELISPEQLDRSDRGHFPSLEYVKDAISNTFDTIDPDHLITMLPNGLIIKDIVISIILDKIREVTILTSDTKLYYRKLYRNLTEFELVNVMGLWMGVRNNMITDGDDKELITLIMDIMSI